MGWIEWLVVKNSDATSWHELLHQFGPFWTECCNATSCPKCIQIVRNTPKHEFRVQWGGSSGLLWKIPKRLHGTNFCTTSARFAPSFVGNQTVPNTSKLYETHKNMSLESNGVDRVCSLRKNPTRLCGTNFCTSLARLELSVVTQQTVPNAPK